MKVTLLYLKSLCILPVQPINDHAKCMLVHFAHILRMFCESIYIFCVCFVVSYCHTFQFHKISLYTSMLRALTACALLEVDLFFGITSDTHGP